MIMSHHLSFEAPSPLQYFATLVADDASFPVLEAAMALAQDETPELDVLAELSRLDACGERLRKRIPADAAPVQRLRLLCQFFYQELGFCGNVNDYYDRRNSLLPVVWQTRRGIPISLALLFIEMANHAGLHAQGVAFPGHFLVKVRLPRGEVVIDPLTGHSLSRETLEERLLPYRQQQGLQLADEAPLGLYLQAASGRDVIARMLRNLKEIHRSTLDWERLVQVQRRLLTLLPQAWEEHRDHALVLAELGQSGAAADAMEVYLSNSTSGEDTPTLRRHLSAWRGAH
jgi:regulator of sirC expression with transglutaminase-like and TPR domain